MLGKISSRFNSKKKTPTGTSRYHPDISIPTTFLLEENRNLLPRFCFSLFFNNRRTCEANVLVFYSLHVEPDGRDSCHHLSELELVQDRRFSGCVQTDLSTAIEGDPSSGENMIKYPAVWTDRRSDKTTSLFNIIVQHHVRYVFHNTPQYSV